MTPSEQQRHDRKHIIFHVLYGTFPTATEGETEHWRTLCVHYINGKTHVVPPLSLESYRRLVHGEEAAHKDPDQSPEGPQEP